MAPELVTDLEKAREAVTIIVENDQKIRRELPRIREQEVAKLKAQYGPEHLVTQLATGEIDKEMCNKKAQWQEYCIQQMAKLTGILMALRRKHGMDDQRLGAEVGKILE